MGSCATARSVSTFAVPKDGFGEKLKQSATKALFAKDVNYTWMIRTRPFLNFIILTLRQKILIGQK